MTTKHLGSATIIGGADSPGMSERQMSEVIIIDVTSGYQIAAKINTDFMAKHMKKKTDKIILELETGGK